MLFHENRLLADDSHEISYFFRKLKKVWQQLFSSAVVIGNISEHNYQVLTFNSYVI